MPSTSQVRVASFRRILAAAAVAAVLATAASASPAPRYDQRLADADAALEKAEVLLANAVCDESFGPKNFHDCEKHLGKSISHLDSARQSLAAAIAAAGGL